MKASTSSNVLNFSQIKILPMVVPDVRNGCYILQSLDKKQEFKLPTGTIEIKNGALVPVSADTYIKLLIEDDTTVATSSNVYDEEGEASGANIDSYTFSIEDSVEEEGISAEMTGGREDQEDTGERHTWTYDETLSLIESMATHLDELNHVRKKKFVFPNVSNDLLANGFSISVASCQNKWKSLLRSYKTAKDNKNKTGRPPSRFLFFERLDELLGEKPSNKCLHALESSNLGMPGDFEITDHETDMHLEEISQNNTVGESREDRVDQRRTGRKRRSDTNFEDLLKSREEENTRRQKRHEEKLPIEQEKLRVEKEKINLLKMLLQQNNNNK